MGHRARDDEPWVADLAEVAAVGLDAGLDLPRAVLAAARSPGVLRSAPWLEDEAVAAMTAGRPVSACLAAAAATHGRPGDETDLRILVAAWRLAEEVGAPAADVTHAAASEVRERRASRHRAAVAVAGPRASMWLLTALPLAGPVGGTLVGVGPSRLYGSGGALAAAVVGLGLTATGWLWARTLLRRAARPATTASP